VQKLALVLMFCGLGLFPARAAFTSFHVFGDSISCTASNPVSAIYSTNYFGKRYTNGRTWVEVLAQMQGLSFDPTNGNPHSFFGNTSSNLFAQATNYTASLLPSVASNTLVVIWVNNADLYFPAYDSPPTYGKFTNAINLAVTNQFKAILHLYTNYIRTIVMPNVVDISSVPEFNTFTDRTNLLHQAATNYNDIFYQMLARVTIGRPDLKIIVPDFFGLLTNMLASPATYGVTNALYNFGSGPLSVGVVENPSLPNKSLNGPGTNYVFWDSTDPTAKVHYTMAGIANALLSPPVITAITPVNGSNRLDLASLPVATAGATNGVILFATSVDQAVWQTNLPGFTSLSTTQSVFVPATWPQCFYRVKSSFTFSWPWVWP
jgi:phospholipase/lecithinase/hemolysin